MNDISNDITIPTHKKDMIKQIQQFLRAISSRSSKIPLIDVDGIFGPETTNAVRAFQQEFGLNSTGVIDNKTLDAIYQEYLRILNLKEANTLKIFEENKILSLGDKSDEIYIIQLIINSINRKFSNIPTVEITGVLDIQTINSINKINEKFKKDSVDYLDQASWNNLSDLYNAINIQ